MRIGAGGSCGQPLQGWCRPTPRGATLKPVSDETKYYRDEDVLVRETQTGSPERWSERKAAWVPYPDFNWGMSHALTEDCRAGDGARRVRGLSSRRADPEAESIESARFCPKRRSGN